MDLTRRSHDVPWCAMGHGTPRGRSLPFGCGTPFSRGIWRTWTAWKAPKADWVFCLFFLNMFSMFSMLDIVGPYGSSKIDGQQLQ